MSNNLARSVASAIVAKLGVSERPSLSRSRGSFASAVASALAARLNVRGQSPAVASVSAGAFASAVAAKLGGRRGFASGSPSAFASALVAKLGRGQFSTRFASVSANAFASAVAARIRTPGRQVAPAFASRSLNATASAIASRLASSGLTASAMTVVASALVHPRRGGTLRSPSLASTVAVRLNDAMARRVASAAVKRLDDNTLSPMVERIVEQLRAQMNEQTASSGKTTEAPDLPASKVKI
jgi:hypothetical protein